MQTQKFNTGDIAYLVEGGRYIREGQIGMIDAGLYVYRFIEGGTILVKEHQLYRSEKEAQAYPDAAGFYIVGCILHLVLDMFNHPFQGHGIWLFYPKKTGKGIAFSVCKAARTGNKILYFIGLCGFVIISIYFLLNIGNMQKCIAPIILL